MPSDPTPGATWLCWHGHCRCVPQRWHPRHPWWSPCPQGWVTSPAEQHQRGPPAPQSLKSTSPYQTASHMHLDLHHHRPLGVVRLGEHRPSTAGPRVLNDGVDDTGRLGPTTVATASLAKGKPGGARGRQHAIIPCVPQVPWVQPVPRIPSVPRVNVPSAEVVSFTHPQLLLQPGVGIASQAHVLSPRVPHACFPRGRCSRSTHASSTCIPRVSRCGCSEHSHCHCRLVRIRRSHPSRRSGLRGCELDSHEPLHCLLTPIYRGLGRCACISVALGPSVRLSATPAAGS